MHHKLAKFAFESTRVSHDVIQYKIRKSSSRELWKWGDFVQGLLGCSQFRREMCHVMRSCEFTAFFFETTPTCPDTLYTDVFEFVLVRSKALKHVQVADMETFSEHWEEDTLAASFWNLGMDAALISPEPSDRISDNLVYAHAANFFRGTVHAPELGNSVWKTVGETLESFMEERPKQKLWLSTSGLGVRYLHFRVDSIPKYITYPPYRESS